ncbi:DNA-directed DNA polymerase [Saliniradius amylolyticus]|uniref:DNA polymerase n=1 Tax=Saliniradius amylolyticus TaxID=2183582 RepID=A0A2S2E846_9ALTE|nr:DNA polymerase II [Saliniradius amylolyticus]AWL13117.1 DNA-directed DNA polymerase [Saliniradius amylolyticus]
MPQSTTISGFILSRHLLSTPEGVAVGLWLLTDEGPAYVQSAPQKLSFFIVSSQQNQAEETLNRAGLKAGCRALELTTFEQQPVSACYFDSPRSFYQARKLLQSQGLVLYEADIRPVDRILMERFIYGAVTASGRPDESGPYPMLLDAKLSPAKTIPAFKVLSLDVECSAQGELYCIGLVGAQFSRVLMIGEPESTRQDIVWLDHEADLLQAFVSQIHQLDPDIITGWNVVNFDFRLLLKRARRYGIPLTLGRDNSEPEWRETQGDSELGFIGIAGRVVVDGIDALKTATYQFDSFSLESVARALLGKGKAVDNVQDRLSEIEHNFHHNKRQLAKYNRQDCQLVLDIMRKTRLLPFLALRSRLTGLELDRSGGSVAAFTNLYLPKLHRAGYVAPNLPADGGLASPGGYVMSSRPGLYDHVLVLDYKSLYPSIIRTFKIDPLGLVEGLKQPETAIPGFKGAAFSREQHFLPAIIQRLWQQRDEAKKAGDQARSQAIKILMNSFYGVLGSGGCRFYDTRLASSITLRGHEIMQTTADWIREQGYEVIYGDTDSTFVWLNQAVTDKEARQIGRRLAQEINQRWRSKLAEELALESDLEMEFETHFRRFLMPTIRGSEQGSKKRYAGLKVTPDGQTELVFKGLESVRSDWTELARQFQHELYRRVFEQQPVGDYIRTLVARVRAGECDEQLVYRKRLRRKLDDYKRNIPPHVRAARLADRLNQQQGKPRQYQRKGWIRYFITVSGPEPLEYHSSAIDYEHYIERQIRPVADAVLPFIGEDFERITAAQLGLF